MKFLSRGTVVASLIAGSAAVAPAQATEASFGCKVLLCAAGNWSAIPYCAPIMAKALRNVRKGRGWPFCAEAGMSSKPGSLVRPGGASINPQTGNDIDPATGDDVVSVDDGALEDTATPKEGYGPPEKSAAPAP